MEFPCIGEHKLINQDSIQEAPGFFIQLSAGNTHYQTFGPPDGELVVLVHGIAGPMDIWYPLADSLSEKGIQVLTYDLFGRGYSERPLANYDVDLFRFQLEELLSRITSQTPYALVGWSLGGLISSAFAAKNPRMVDRLVLIAPAGIEISLPFLTQLILIPILGEIIFCLFGRWLVFRSILGGLFREELRGELASLISTQTRYKGYLRAFLSTLRCCGYLDASEIYRQAGSNKVKVLMISGSNDHSIPSSVQGRMRTLIRNFKHTEIKDAGHFPHFERPDEVANVVLNFLDSV